MTGEEKRRPNPDDLLKDVTAVEMKRNRGHLRVFFGMCPGVGKTYAMLRAAHDRKKDGIDVVVGLVETHDRVDTASLLNGLEQIPRREISYKSTLLYEMDLDAILKRKPRLVLVDELPHTNSPGSRHLKRYQDVQEILASGIDVYTTLNVQHIESRSDLVYQITGIAITEKVPDSFLDSADQVELIDLSPEELLQRLHEGKVYLGERGARAANGFFKHETLIALRELALRYTAEKVDSQLRSHRVLKQIPGVWNTNERLMVAISFSPYSARLIRATRRMAYNLEAPWIALYVDTGEKLSEGDLKQLKKNISLARELGAEVVQSSEPNLVAAVKQIAHEKNVTQIVIGRPDKRFIRDFLTQGTILDQLVRETSEIDIHVIRQERVPRYRGFRFQLPRFQAGSTPYLKTFFFLSLVSGLSFYFTSWIGYRAVGFILLSAILLVGTLTTFGPILFAAAFSSFIWNYFFIPPRFTFDIKEPEDVMNVIAFFIVAFVVGYFTSRIKGQEASLTERAYSLTGLYEFTRSLASAKSTQEILQISREVLERVFKSRFEILLRESLDDLAPLNQESDRKKIDSKERALAAWSFRNAKIAGSGTDTLSSSECLSIPLRGQSDILGVVVIWPNKDLKDRPELESLRDTFISNIAMALERSLFQDKSKETEALATSEKLHQALLSSVSHELKTPLTAIIGNATALKLDAQISIDKSKTQTVDDLVDASIRLNRVVENLLDMTRISSGALKIREDIFELNDFVDSTLARYQSLLKNRPVIFVRASQDIYVKGDDKLLEHVLSNLLSNSANYSPVGSEIKIEVEVDQNKSFGLVTVTDCGPGIPEDSAERVFERFYRVPGTPTGGTGLGLSIAKALVEAMGGTIRLRNRTDQKGSLFTFSIPITTLTFNKDGLIK